MDDLLKPYNLTASLAVISKVVISILDFCKVMKFFLFHTIGSLVLSDFLHGARR